MLFGNLLKFNTSTRIAFVLGAAGVALFGAGYAINALTGFVDEVTEGKPSHGPQKSRGGSTPSELFSSDVFIEMKRFDELEGDIYDQLTSDDDEPTEVPDALIIDE